MHFPDLSRTTTSGHSHTVLGKGPGPMELGKLALCRLKLGKSVLSLCMKFSLLG